MLRTSSSTTSTFLPASTGSVVVQLLEHLPLGLGQVGLDAVQEQRGLVQQPLGRLHVLDDDGLGERFSSVSSFWVSSLPV